jgi:hypothetical protein
MLDFACSTTWLSILGFHPELAFPLILYQYR